MPRTVYGRNKQMARRLPRAMKVDEPSLLEEDLMGMTKTELVDLAGSLGIAVAPKATKAQITEAILAQD